MYSTTIVLLSFEAPSPYAAAGGVSSRVSGLAEGLAGMGYETHLFFVGDPDLPSSEVRHNGRLHLHRWCQWTSAQHRGNAYDGEADKVRDLSESLPRWLADNLLEEKIGSGGSVVVLAEEWRTAGAVASLRRLVEERGWLDRAYLLWNASSANSLDVVPWDALGKAAVMTTVSRYMRTVLGRYGVEARVIPNGVSEELLRPPSHAERQMTHDLFAQRVAVVKPEGWDAQGAEAAVSAAAIMKRMGMAPFLIVGGCGERGGRFAGLAESSGLTVSHAVLDAASAHQMVDVVRGHRHADVVLVGNGLALPQRQLLFLGAAAVLASSAREPFGTMGLEAMACGGIAMVGCSGEDYATPGHDSISLQTMDPWEIVHNVAVLQDSIVKATSIRRNARRTAERYTWGAVIRRCLLPALSMIGVPRVDVEARHLHVAPIASRPPAHRKEGHPLVSAA